MPPPTLTEPERTDVRRFCGYPPAGAGLLGALSATGSQDRGTLELRMTNLTVAEIAIVRRYLATLTILEVAIPRAAENLDTDQAAIWTHNKSEVRDRLHLLDEWRRRLCAFLGVPPGRGLRDTPVALVI